MIATTRSFVRHIEALFHMDFGDYIGHCGSKLAAQGSLPGKQLA